MRQELPPGFQTSEFLLEHGFVDMVVHRKELRQRLISVLRYSVREMPAFVKQSAKQTGRVEAPKIAAKAAR